MMTIDPDFNMNVTSYFWLVIFAYFSNLVILVTDEIIIHHFQNVAGKPQQIVPTLQNLYGKLQRTSVRVPISN